MPPRNHPWLPIVLPSAASTPRHGSGRGEEAAWFAVRFVLVRGRSTRTGRPVYEERLTLWRASSVEEAVSRAEAEAKAYAATIAETAGGRLGPAQVYRLPGDPGDGAELFASVPDECAAAHHAIGGSGAKVRT